MAASMYTDDESKRIAQDLYQNKSARCPHDGARIVAEKSPIMRSAAHGFYFYCERCHSSGDFTPEPSPDADKWTSAEVKVIEDVFWRSSSAICPRDKAVLTVRKLDELGSTRLLISCSFCGRTNDTGESKPASR